jgi:putative hydrolase of the HAD superfamily
MVRAVLCDFDGVIRIWHESDAARIEGDFRLPPGTLADAAFTPALLRQATTGAISDEEWRERVSEMLVAEHGEGARAAVSAWSRLSGALDDEMLNLLREVRHTAPVALLTNATTRLEHDLEALGLQDAFDAIANSSTIGVTKPERGIFEQAAALVGVSLGDCVFIDDQPSHLDAARAAGAYVIHHRTAAATRDALAALGLPLSQDTGQSS